MQTSCFSVFQFFQILNSITSITGGGGSCSDFLSFKILQALNKFHLSLNFFRMRVSGSRHVYNFVSSKSGITLLQLS